MFWELPAEAPESWFLGLFFFFWHIPISWATWLHSYIRSLGSSSTLSESSHFIKECRFHLWEDGLHRTRYGCLVYSLLWVSVLLWPLSRTAVLNHWARFSLQGTCGNVWKSMNFTTEEMVLKFSGKRPRMLIKHPTMHRQDSPTPQQICVYPRHQWCWSWEILS